MAAHSLTERYEVSLNTPAGQVTSSVDVPTSFVPISAIVPVMRRLGERAHELEQRRALEAGATISCQRGCAACCRMLVPVSAPEAFALKDAIDRLPDQRRTVIGTRLEATKAWLQAEALLEPLNALAETTTPVGDEEFEPINRRYYALRIPCPFLEDESCSIYDDRPAACRELLVTSPAPLCEDLTDPAIRPVPVSLRMSTALGLLWAEVTNTVPRLIPLPLALGWAERHQGEHRRTWQGSELLDKVLEKIWRLLSQELAQRKGMTDEE